MDATDLVGGGPPAAGVASKDQAWLTQQLLYVQEDSSKSKTCPLWPLFFDFETKSSLNLELEYNRMKDSLNELAR